MRKLSIFVSHPSDFLTDHRAYGDGRCAFDLINRLAERGHHLTVAYSQAELAKPLHRNISLFRIKCILPSNRLQMLEYMFRVRSLFVKLHQSGGFDVIHQLNPVFPGLSAMVTGYEVPLVLGLFVPGWPSEAEVVMPITLRSRLGRVFLAPWIEKASRWQQDRAAALLLSTPAAEQVLHNPNGARSRTSILPYGIDVDEYIPTLEKLGEKILFIGSLERRKGIFFLAEAFRSIWRARPKARLMIVGKGSQREALEKAIKQDESSSAVEFLGEITGSAKIALLQSAA